MSEDFFDEKEKKALELTVRRNIYLLVKKFAGCQRGDNQAADHL